VAKSKELVAPDFITYENYNDLRKDVLDPTLGHSHLGGTDEGKKLSGAFIGGDADFGNFKIVNLGAPTASGDAANKGYVDPPNLAYLPLAGGTMTGTILSNVSEALKRSGDANEMNIRGGENYVACIELRGREFTGSEGTIAGLVPNAAGTGYAVAFKFSGRTDSPEMISGSIPVDRLKVAEYSATAVLAGEEASRTLWMSNRSFWPFVESDQTVEGNAKCSVGWDELVGVTTRGQPCTFRLWATYGVTVTFTYGYWYLTSSRPPEIWLQIDKEGTLLSVCSCETGMDIRPPLELLDRTAFLAEVLITPEEYKELQKQARDAGTTVAMFVHKNIQLSEQTAKIGEFEFKLDFKRKEEVRFTRWISKIVKKLEKRKVPVLELKKVFNEINGQWEEQEMPKIELVSEMRYRLREPELGEQSKIEQYEIMVPRQVYEEKEIEVEEEIEVEVPIT